MTGAANIVLIDPYNAPRQIGENANEAAHACAVLRFKGERPAYHPSNLREYMESPEPNVAESGMCPPEPPDE